MLEYQSKKRPYYFFATVFFFLLIQCSLIEVRAGKDEHKILVEMPQTHVALVVDTVYGQVITDPYRWLEDDDSPEVQKWTEDQNAYTRYWLDRVPQRNYIYNRLKKLLSIGYLGSPVVRKNGVFYTKRMVTENQPVLYLKVGLENVPRVIIDPNMWSKDGTIAMDWWVPSEDGRFVAYGVSEGGSEKSTLHLRQVSTGKDISDTIPYTPWADVAWLKDNSGFYYTRHPAPGTVPKGEENYYRRVFFHRLGTSFSDDSMIFGEGHAKDEWPQVSLSADGRYLLLSVWEGWSRSEIYFQDLKRGSELNTLTKDMNSLFWGEILGDTLYLFTNYRAPHYRLFSVNLKKPQPENWKELIPEGDTILKNFDIVGSHIVIESLESACSRLSIYTLAGKLETEIPLTAMGSVSGMSGEWNSNYLFFGFESFLLPMALYRYSIDSGSLEVLDQLKTDLNFSGFEQKQVWYESKDGTKVSMFMVHKRGLKLNGQSPTLLTGYGGFNVSMTPYFSPEVYFWIENGGIFAVPNLRGGGEYGEEWHRAGMFENKQRVFDDFISAAEWLIHQGYTNPRKLAISGGSNGGLLVGATLTQRSDLFDVVVCKVPLLDMIRYHKFDIAELSIHEYGSPEDSSYFRYLYAYSPYHHVQKDRKYPAVLLTAGSSDSRVNPLHARKMAAILQSSTSSKSPILLRVETKTGHGQGEPFGKQIEESTDIYSFLFWQLGIKD